MRIDSVLNVADGNDDRTYTADQVIAALNGTASTRTTIAATYRTPTISPTVYYTALNPDGTVRTPRSTSGVTLLSSGLYQYLQPRTSDFVAVWDEGDPAEYSDEYIMVGA